VTIRVASKQTRRPRRHSHNKAQNIRDSIFDQTNAYYEFVAYEFVVDILTRHSTINMAISGNVIIHSFPLFDLACCITHRWHTPQECKQQIIGLATSHPCYSNWMDIQLHVIEYLRVDVAATEMSLNDLDAGSLAWTVLFVDPQQGTEVSGQTVTIFIANFLNYVI
jgi:hypothetical protein